MLTRTASRVALRAPGRLSPAYAATRTHEAKFVTAPPLPQWEKLGFSATPTKAMIRYDWDGQQWNSGTSTSDFNISIHGLSNVLHYGQALFEGLKAFHCKDGKVRIFNSKANAARLKRGAERLAMPVVPTELFEEAIDRAVRDNVDYVPPYGYGGAMYLRPFLFGHGEKLGLGAAPHYTFCVIASPVGAYYKGGLEPIDALVIDEFDRAAPRGVGGIKCAGNYAPDVLPSIMAKERGFPVCLYLDAATQTYIEEFSTSNFIGVTQDGTVVTPTSPSILPSCTKGVVLATARQLGLKVEERPISMAEAGTFKEVAACGTAVVLTPIQSITRGDTVYKYHTFDTIAKLYDMITAVQAGEAEDSLGVTRTVCEKPHNPPSK
uniref:Branched-chain-amino-acid transaminase n=1 Tax=Strombidinopsis acuminata TaxID=141414 RepID=A0A7S3WUW4_9SPIT